MTAAYDWGFNTNIQSQIEYTSAISSFKERFFFKSTKIRAAQKYPEPILWEAVALLPTLKKEALPGMYWSSCNNESRHQLSFGTCRNHS